LSPSHRAPTAEAPRSVTVLGATGSVGTSTLELIAARPELYRVEAVTAWHRVEALAEAARRVEARLAVIADPNLYDALKAALAGSGIEAAAGPAAMIEAAERPADWVMAAVVGAAGLEPTMAAIRRGAMVALANKECLVCAGALLMAEAHRRGAMLLPVDSEHNAIFQALGTRSVDEVERLVLTASGGPFRTMSLEAMARVTPAEAVAHPTWSMGAKISIDSATMMNKGLEVIEAHHLFAMPEAQIDILVHPQSIVHSLVAFKDGAMLAELGPPDMRVPIAFTLGWPGRLVSSAARLDLAEVARLDFERPDPARFRAPSLARDALRLGGGAPTILNAANECAVAAFLEGRIGFLDIVGVVEAVLEATPAPPPGSIEEVCSLDAEARREAAEVIARHVHAG